MGLYKPHLWPETGVTGLLVTQDRYLSHQPSASEFTARLPAKTWYANCSSAASGLLQDVDVDVGRPFLFKVTVLSKGRDQDLHKALSDSWKLQLQRGELCDALPLDVAFARAIADTGWRSVCSVTYLLHWREFIDLKYVANSLCETPHLLLVFHS